MKKGKEKDIFQLTHGHLKDQYMNATFSSADSTDKLTPIQQIAVDQSEKKAKVSSKNTYLNVLERFISLDYSDDHLKTTLNYIRDDVKPVIHIMIETLIQYFIDDGFYRNQFETHKSRGTLSSAARLSWEKNLFRGVYDISTGPEKVKYGALNLLNCKNGVISAHRYGDSYMILKEHVKNRITFASGDSASMQLHLGTFKNPGILLNVIDDGLLKELIEISNGLKESSATPYGYVEMQVHGKINIKKDVHMIVVNDRHQNNEELVKKLDHLKERDNVEWMFAAWI